MRDLSPIGYYCSKHEIRFHTRVPDVVECPVGLHVLHREGPFPDFWEFCEACRTLWPQGIESARACQSCGASARSFRLCAECGVIALESDPQSATRSCPACHADARSQDEMHE